MTTIMLLVVLQQPVQVTAGALNVRSGPGTGYAIQGVAHSGEVYVQISTSGSWRKIWFNGGTGWVYGSYVTSSSATIGKVTAATLNVRSGPGSGYSVVGTAPSGAWYAIQGSSGDWRKISYGGAQRWVHGAYLTNSGVGGGTTPPTSSAGFIQLPASGPGFYTYSPAANVWGKPTMVYGLQNTGAQWKAEHPTWGRMGVGDISLMNGGPMPGHVSHQLGRDVDVRPIRNDGVEGPTAVGYSSYSSSRTNTFALTLKNNLPITITFFNDPAIYNAYSWVDYYQNHDNHLHVRIP